ncbi:Uncharacterized membrane protein YhaH, DUF805 family [Brevibacterium casei CIP 102111]|nr:Uncharacterized membrane protein YhaH, DUF805 family [Brevibacterium casei CIP 102111]
MSRLLGDSAVGVHTTKEPMTETPQSPLPADGGAPAAVSPQAASGRTDLSQPLPGASFPQAVRRFFKKYTVFTGRASRSEFWWAYLLVAVLSLIPNVIMMIGLSIGASWAAANPKVTELGVDPTTGEAVTVETAPGIVNHPPAAILIFVGLALLIVVVLAVIVPFLAVVVRRLHDANMAGPMAFLLLVPFVGTLIVLVLMLLPSKPEGARFDRA